MFRQGMNLNDTSRLLKRTVMITDNRDRRALYMVIDKDAPGWILSIYDKKNTQLASYTELRETKYTKNLILGSNDIYKIKIEGGNLVRNCVFTVTLYVENKEKYFGYSPYTDGYCTSCVYCDGCMLKYLDDIS